MNQRDFQFIENRMYDDGRLGEAAVRLHRLGYVELAQAATDADRTRCDTLRRLRMMLREEQARLTSHSR